MLALARGMGLLRGGCIESTMKGEAGLDLFAEQVWAGCWEVVGRGDGGHLEFNGLTWPFWGVCSLRARLVGGCR